MLPAFIFIMNNIEKTVIGIKFISAVLMPESRHQSSHGYAVTNNTFSDSCLLHVRKEWIDHFSYGYIKMSYHMLRNSQKWATEQRVWTIYKELGLKGQTPVFITTKSAKKEVAKYVM